MKKRAFCVIMLAGALVFSASCRSGIGTNLSLEKVNKLEVKKKSDGATADYVRALFGEPPLVVDLGGGRERWTYLESHVRSVSWLLVSGYLVYKPTNTLVHNAALEVTIKDGKVEDMLFVNDNGEQEETAD